MLSCQTRQTQPSTYHAVGSNNAWTYRGAITCAIANHTRRCVKVGIIEGNGHGVGAGLVSQSALRLCRMSGDIEHGEWDIVRCDIGACELEYVDSSFIVYVSIV